MAARGSGRAVWVWSVRDLDGAWGFLERRRVTELFLHVPWEVRRRRDERARIADAVARAHRAGMRVSALGGTPDWIHRPGEVVRRWLRPALEAAPFDGVHLDVELDFGQDRARAARGLVDVAETVRTQLLAAMSLEVDVRFWYPSVRVGDTDLARALCGPADCLSVMSYRRRTTGADGSIELTRPTARAVAETGRAFRVGQETLDLGPGPVQTKQTFFGRPAAELDAALGRLREAFADAPGFAGVAVHDLPGWRALPRG